MSKIVCILAHAHLKDFRLEPAMGTALPIVSGIIYQEKMREATGLFIDLIYMRKMVGRALSLAGAGKRQRTGIKEMTLVIPASSCARMNSRLLNKAPLTPHLTAVLVPHGPEETNSFIRSYCI